MVAFAEKLAKEKRVDLPAGYAKELRSAGVAAVFTPKDFGITGIIGRIVDEIRLANKLEV